MTLDNFHIKRFLVVYFLIGGLKTYAQDSTLKFTLDSFVLETSLFQSYQPRLNFINHSPTKQDEQCFKKYKSLIGKQPTSRNYKLYFSLAGSLWDLGKLEEAEKMFLTIVNSQEDYYTATYYHSSVIPGDNKKNVYGYGSFTSNYKNYAAIYLTKIYLEQKQFDKALQSLEDAVKKYKVRYNCGTGFRRQHNQYEFLYASCYEGLNRHSDVIELLLPSCLSRNDEKIVTAIMNTFSRQEIEESLTKAENSIYFLLDTLPSYTYVTSNYGTKEVKTDTLSYFSGTATMILFGRQITMPVPDLGNGEQVTREMFLKLFRESDFYVRLKEDSRLSYTDTEK